MRFFIFFLFKLKLFKFFLKKKQEDLEYVVLWMTNFCRLIHNLKQYSGETVNIFIFVLFTVMELFFFYLKSESLFFKGFNN